MKAASSGSGSEGVIVIEAAPKLPAMANFEAKVVQVKFKLSFKNQQQQNKAKYEVDDDVRGVWREYARVRTRNHKLFDLSSWSVFFKASV